MIFKAAVLNEFDQPLSIQDLKVPKLLPGQVLVRIKYAGICHSQLNEIGGKKGEDKFLPHTLGHEGSGIVEAVGPSVEKVKPQDQVVITWLKGSGMNVPSTIYQNSDDVPINSGPVSTFMELAVVSENRLVKIPAQFPLPEAALLGCAIPTGAGMVLNTEPDKQLDSIAVFGAGGVGLSAIMAAKIRGIKRIITIDKNDEKLNLAQNLGATDIINASDSNSKDTILKLTKNTGVDLAIESAGQKITMEDAFQCTSAAGGTCILAGNLAAGQTIEINPMHLIQGRKLVGSWGGGCDPDRDLPLFIDLYLKRELNLNALISREYALQEINNACKDLLEGRSIRPLLCLEP